MAASALVFFLVWWLGASVDGDNERNINLWRAFLVFNVCRGLFLGLAYVRVTRARAWLVQSAA
jgi:MATE family multidrug resistance protein